MQEGKTCSSLLDPQKVAQKFRAKSKQAYEFTSLGRPPYLFKSGTYKVGCFNPHVHLEMVRFDALTLK